MACTKYPPLVECRYSLPADFQRRSLYEPKSQSVSFSLFSSYEKERIALSFFLNQNNGHFAENGGVKDISFIIDSTNQKAENIPVNLSSNDISNNYRNTNFQLQGQYNIGNPKEVTTPTDTFTTYPAKAIINIRAEGNERRYKEGSIAFDFFPHTYIDSTSTTDLITNQVYDISTKFVMNEHPKYKYLPGIYAGLDLNTKTTGSGQLSIRFPIPRVSAIPAIQGLTLQPEFSM